MIQDPFNPYGINRFPRIYRPRASSSGGIRAGAVPQMMGPQPGGRQGSGGGIPMGGSSTTTGPAQEQQQQGGALSGLLAGKETYDQITDAYKGGRNIQNASTKPGGLMDQGQDALTGLGNFFGNSYTPTNSAISGFTRGLDLGGAASTMGPGGQAYTLPLDFNGTAMPTHWSGSGTTSQLPKGLQNVVTPPPTAAQAGVPAAQSGTQLNSGTQVGAETAAANSSSNALAGAGAVAGMGLSAYDMYENGINFGNAAGFAGAGILAGTTMMGLANAWNPVGWALLAGSAAYSIFG